MANTVNRVELIGFVGKNPNIRYTPTSGAIIAEFSLATTNRRRDPNDNTKWIEEPEWHNIVAFKRTAEFLRDNLKQGAKVRIVGPLKTRNWPDKDNPEKKHYMTQILVNEFMFMSPKANETAPATTSAQQVPPANAVYSESDLADDNDVPF